MKKLEKIIYQLISYRAKKSSLMIWISTGRNLKALVQQPSNIISLAHLKIMKN